MIEVRYFRTRRGDEPVALYVNGLPLPEKANLRALVDQPKAAGYLRFPEARKMGKNLWELRSGKQRIFYAYHQGVIVLLHAYRKQSQKTPDKEIETALGRLALLRGEYS